VGAAEPAASSTPSRFLGELSCSSSSCHGGAKANFDQFTFWKDKDIHTRSYATLTTPRSRRLGELLNIAQPGQDSRCTVCHAPFHEVPERQRDPSVRVDAGVSCENCHGAAEPWLRAHTRPDFSHADRVTAGLHDLGDLYQRANRCAACHQNIEPDLLRAGHPPLLFELDGQAVTQPKHWRERGEWHGGRAWLVGQAVALRELSWQLERIGSGDTNAVIRWQGLLWVLQEAVSAVPALPQLAGIGTEPTAANLKLVREKGDQLAVQAAASVWSSQRTGQILRKLAGLQKHFSDATPGAFQQACRAERLVLGLDRLFLELWSNEKAPESDRQLAMLYQSIQSLPDFKPAEFAQRLAAFAKGLAPLPDPITNRNP
jgi:hypothetical protein